MPLFPWHQEKKSLAMCQTKSEKQEKLQNKGSSGSLEKLLWLLFEFSQNCQITVATKANEEEQTSRVFYLFSVIHALPSPKCHPGELIKQPPWPILRCEGTHDKLNKWASKGVGCLVFHP